jgi:hypothetical protein
MESYSSEKPGCLLTIVLAVLLCLTHSGCENRKENKEGTIQIHKIYERLKIDGKLDESAWNHSARTGVFRRFDGQAAAQQSTEAMLCWDDKNLYLAFVCRDRDITSSYKHRDEPLYLQEAVELFLDPDSDRKDYMEFEVSPASVTFDASFSARRTGMKLSFNPQMQVSVLIDGTLNNSSDEDISWTVEMAIPFDQMTGRGRRPPRASDCWRMNMFRLDVSKNQKEASAWRPTKGDFHDLSAFGTICFSQ